MTERARSTTLYTRYEYTVLPCNILFQHPGTREISTVQSDTCTTHSGILLPFERRLRLLLLLLLAVTSTKNNVLYEMYEYGSDWYLTSGTAGKI